MEDYNMQNNKFIKNGLVIIERQLIDIERLKIDRITDDNLLRHLEYYKDGFNKLKTIIVTNPRFNWVNIQEGIDRLYAMDPNLTGVNFQLDWKHGGNRAFIKHVIGKN